MRIPDLRTTTRAYVTPIALAEFLCISRRNIYYQIEKGALPATKIGGVWRIPTDAARAFAGLNQDPEPLPTPYVRAPHSHSC